MSRVPSDKTVIANMKRRMRELDAQLAKAQREAQQYRVRATTAEQQCAEWKQRFDILLRREPKDTQ